MGEVTNQFTNQDLQAKYEQLNKDGKITKVDISILINLGNKIAESLPDNQKESVLKDIKAIENLMKQNNFEKDEALNGALQSFRNQYSRLYLQILNENGFSNTEEKTDSKEKFDIAKKSYETLQDWEVKLVEAEYKKTLDELKNLGLKKIETQFKEGFFKKGQEIYIKDKDGNKLKNPDGSFKTIFDETIKAFHDAIKGSSEAANVQKKATEIVEALEKKIEDIINDKRNGPQKLEIAGGREITNETELNLILDKIFVNKNSIETDKGPKTKQEIKDAVLAGRLVDIKITTKEGKTTYTYSEIIIKTPNAKGSLTITEVSETSGTTGSSKIDWPANFDSLFTLVGNESAIKDNIEFKDGKITFNSLDKSGVSKSITIESDKEGKFNKKLNIDLSKVQIIDKNGKKIIQDIEGGINIVNNSSFNNMPINIISEKNTGEIQTLDPNAIQTALETQKEELGNKFSGFETLIKGLNISFENGKVKYNGKEYTKPIFNLKYENGNWSLVDVKQGGTQAINFSYTTTEILNSGEGLVSEYKDVLKTVGIVDKKTYEALGEKHAIIISIDKNGKATASKVLKEGRTDLNGDGKIFIKKEGTNSQSEKLDTLNANGSGTLNRYGNKLDSLVIRGDFLKDMKEINNNNSTGYREFIRLAQAGNYKAAFDKIDDLFAGKTLQKEIQDTQKLLANNSTLQRKFVDDVMEAAFGDRAMEQNHFKIKLDHLKDNNLGHLFDNFKTLDTGFGLGRNGELSYKGKITLDQGLFSVLSLRGPKGSLQRGFTTHTELKLAENTQILDSKNPEFEKTKKALLNDLKLTDEMKQTYLKSRGLNVDIKEASKAWTAIVSGGTFTLKGEVYSVREEKIKLALVTTCENPALKYEFLLQKKVKTTVPGAPSYSPIVPTFTPNTPTNGSGQFGVNTTSTPTGEPQETPVPVTFVPGENGSHTETPSTWTPDFQETPGNSETIPLNAVDLNIIVDNPTPVPPVEIERPERPERQRPNTRPDTPTEAPGVPPSSEPIERPITPSQAPLPSASPIDRP